MERLSKTMRGGRVRSLEEEFSGDSFLPPPGHAFWRQRDVAEQTLRAIKVLEEDRNKILAELDKKYDLEKSVEWLQVRHWKGVSEYYHY